jgi:RND family efflux transporter MFP subunit
MTARFCLLLSVALIAGGCKDEESAPHEVQSATAASAEVRPVKTVVARAETLPDDRAIVGDIRPVRTMDLSFRVASKLVERAVDVGSAFRKGDILARVDDEEYRHRLESAEADVAAAKAVLVEATAAFERQNKLFLAGYVTRANFDTAVKSVKSAEAKLDASVASVALAQTQLDHTQLKATFDGIVTAVAVEEGQVVNVGQMVIQAAEPDKRDAVFSVPLEAFGTSVPGDDVPGVIVSSLADPTIAVRGRVREIAPLADAATGTYEVRVALDTVSPSMRFGATVSGRLDKVAEPVFLLPSAALSDLRGVPAVWVVDPDTSTVSLSPVEVERYETGKVVIGTGLSEGDVVVTGGVNRLREDQKVLLVTEAE